jgi:uncharacterized MAPEG superfamily protein
MDAFAPYWHSIIAMMIIVLLWAVMGPVSAVMKEKAGAAPGGSVPEDYASPAYRWDRAYANLTEGLPAFAIAVFGAMLAGANPFWINLFTALFVVGRIAMAVVHVQGVGKPSGGLRSILYSVGWAMTILIAVFAIVAVF